VQNQKHPLREEEKMNNRATAHPAGWLLRRGKARGKPKWTGGRIKISPQGIRRPSHPDCPRPSVHVTLTVMERWGGKMRGGENELCEVLCKLILEGIGKGRYWTGDRELRKVWGWKLEAGEKTAGGLKVELQPTFPYQ